MKSGWRQDVRTGFMHWQIHCPSHQKVFPLDLADEKAIEVLSLALEKEQPFIQFLINAAGFGKMGSYKDIPLKELDHMVLVNCKAMMDITQICIPYTKKEAGYWKSPPLLPFSPFRV